MAVTIKPVLTAHILKQITDLGWHVSIHRMPASLHGTVGPYVEMHAVHLVGTLPPQVARCNDGDGPEEDYRCACMLAEAVGIRLEG